MVKDIKVCSLGCTINSFYKCRVCAAPICKWFKVNANRQRYNIRKCDIEPSWCGARLWSRWVFVLTYNTYSDCEMTRPSVTKLTKKNVLPDPENQDLLKLKSAQISQNKPMDPVCLRTDGIWLITQSETLHLKYWHTEEPMGSKQVNNNNNNNNNNISIACCIKRCVVVHYSFHPLYVFLRVNNKITILLSG